MAEDKKRIMKELIKQLHAGVAPEEVKQRFEQVLTTVTPLEISKIEQELVDEGMPREEIHRLCEVHLLVFQEQLEKQKPEAPTASPINILSEEHTIMLQLLEMVNTILVRFQSVQSANDAQEDMAHLKHIAEDLVDSEKHYLREENVLFPVLEKHGVREPPAIMWTEHNQIRPMKKEFCSTIENHKTMSFQVFREQLGEKARSLNNLLSSHFRKENNILFPTALKVVTDDEWIEVRKEFDSIGYCRFTPQHLIAKPQVEAVEPKHGLPAVAVPEGLLQLETGAFSKDQIQAILKTLPVDITFVDKDDFVRYFNKSEIFMRTKAVIGRKVQLCHPQKSVHIVNKILESFKAGKKDVAEFWIPQKERMIHIRYFAVRDRDGKYVGTMEVVQDITDIKKIEGQRRLLDWKD
jgi:PAS domain S-box-containing protein